MAEGQLPNLAKLAAQGGFYRLETSHSPESPTSWASFATGVQRGQAQHLRLPGPRTRRPTCRTSASSRRCRRSSCSTTCPIKKPEITSIRGGTSFWVTAGQHGVRSSLLTVPITFPPEDVENGELLSGLPLPDIRGTIGTFYYFATDLSRYEEGNTEMGGILKRLVMDKGVARTRTGRPAEPDRQGAAAGDPGEGRRAVGRRQGGAGRAHRPRGHPPARSRSTGTGRSAGRRSRSTAHEHQPRRRRVEQVGHPRVPGEPPRAPARHGAAVPRPRRQGAAALHLAGELAARTSRRCRSRRPASFSSQTQRPPRALPDARLGRGDLAAQRGPDRREGVHGRPVPRLRRPRAGHRCTASTPGSGTCSSASSSRPTACST